MVKKELIYNAQIDTVRMCHLFWSLQYQSRVQGPKYWEILSGRVKEISEYNSFIAELKSHFGKCIHRKHVGRADHLITHSLIIYYFV